MNHWKINNNPGINEQTWAALQRITRGAAIIFILFFAAGLFNMTFADSGAGEVTITDGSRSEITWNDKTGTVEFPFSCENGSYCVVLKYVPMDDESTDIMASIRIDGEYPSKEFESVEFPRCWVPESKNYFDENGNEYAAYLIQKERLMTEAARDKDGLLAGNLTVNLSEGQHTLELKHLSGTMKIKEIRLVPETRLPSYKEYFKNTGGKEYHGKSILIEGENAESRSSRDIPCYSYNDAAMSPSGNGKTRINAFGGSYWYKPNSSGTWKFSVPKDGMYKISLRFMQNNEGLTSQRQILIDGKVPFREMEAYPFTYGRKFRTEALGGETPYQFYLTKGEHTLTMRAVASMYREPVREFSSEAEELDDIVSEIQQITGTSPDPNFDYELGKKIPDTIKRLKKVSKEIEDTADKVDKLCGEAPAVTSNIHADAETMRDLTGNIRKLPSEFGTVTTVQGDLEDAASTLQSQPLGIDWIDIQSPDSTLLEPKASVIERIRLSAMSFINSFQDTDQKTDKKQQTITVWVARDKEWANVLQKLIREDFEPKYGIKVKLNVLPSGNTTVVSGASPLLLSVVSGNTPDVALGCDSRTPVELAIRGELCDLNQFDDFSKVKKEFRSGAVRALEYDNGCYGLPETADMPVMVYRTDTLKQNGIKVPETWNELMLETLPRLSQVDGNFYMGSSSPDMYATMLYQMGGDLYDKDGNCVLDTPEAVNAFQQWTKCFVQYNVPQSANFYNEMRTGKLPIGICSLSEYMQMKEYAAELTGRIRIARVPGTASKESEKIRHDSTGDVTSAVIFKDASDKEACWTFLKWWLSEDVQTKFALEVESRVGSTGRWMTANKAAFLNLPWNKQEKAVLADSMEDFRTFYNVAGGYYSGRAVTNAWTRTVFSGMDPRDSLEQCYSEIEEQVTRKKKQYDK